MSYCACAHCGSYETTTDLEDRSYLKEDQVHLVVPDTSDVNIFCFNCNKISTIANDGYSVKLNVCPECGEVENICEAYSDYNRYGDTYEYYCEECHTPFN